MTTSTPQTSIETTPSKFAVISKTDIAAVIDSGDTFRDKIAAEAIMGLMIKAISNGAVIANPEEFIKRYTTFYK